MINRILMELYDDYEKKNTNSLIEFTNKTLPQDGTDKLFIGCVLIMFSLVPSRYYCTREKLADIISLAKYKVESSNLLEFYISRVNRDKKITKRLNKVVKDKNLDKYADLVLEYLDQFKSNMAASLIKDEKIKFLKYVDSLKK